MFILVIHGDRTRLVLRALRKRECGVTGDRGLF